LRRTAGSPAGKPAFKRACARLRTVDSAEQARALVRPIGPEISFYKIGMELYCAAGMDFVFEPPSDSSPSMRAAP
jgi:hypothetical protein